MFDSHDLTGTSFNRFIYCSKTSTCESSMLVTPLLLAGEDKTYSLTPPASDSGQRVGRLPLHLLFHRRLSLEWKKSLFPVSQ